MLIALPQTDDTIGRFRWLLGRVGSINGELNRRKFVLAATTIVLIRSGYEYEPRRCNHCEHWMTPYPMVEGGRYQGMRDVCNICDLGLPLKDFPPSVLDLGRPIVRSESSDA